MTNHNERKIETCAEEEGEDNGHLVTVVDVKRQILQEKKNDIFNCQFHLENLCHWQERITNYPNEVEHGNKNAER